MTAISNLRANLLHSLNFWTYPLFSETSNFPIIWVCLFWLFCIAIICFLASSSKFGSFIPPLRRLYRKAGNYILILFFYFSIVVLSGMARFDFLSSRYYAAIAVFLACIVISFFVYQLYFIYPKDKRHYFEEMNRLKYLPKKKKRS